MPSRTLGESPAIRSSSATTLGRMCEGNGDISYQVPSTLYRNGVPLPSECGNTKNQIRRAVLMRLPQHEKDESRDRICAVNRDSGTRNASRRWLE